MLTREDVVKVMKFKQGDLSLRQFALQVGCSAAYLSDIYSGNRAPATKVLDYLGMEKRKTVKVEYFQKKKWKR